MRKEPALFATYHAGYADQVRRWPRNPLDGVIAHLRAAAQASEELVVADMGCGEARLAAELGEAVDVRSFDLVAANDRVTACDIARTPLAESVADFAVFCLSLMGTNYGEFLVEARRVLKPGGTVLVVEVASRFEEQDPRAFKAAVGRLGFQAVDDHAFVVAGRKEAAGGDGSGKGAKMKKDVGKGKGKGKQGKLGKQKRGGKGSLFDSAPGSAAVGSGAFFLHFAFQSTKKTNGQAKNAQKMPALKACVYKKR